MVLVTRQEYTKGKEVFQAADGLDFRPATAEEEPLAAAVREAGCRAVVVGVEPYRGPLYEALGETGGAAGSLIARFGVGCDNISTSLTKKHRITLTNTAGALDQSVAEHTIWLLGALTRRITAGDQAFRAGRWSIESGGEIRGQTLALLGFGVIGRRVAAIAHYGFCMRVLAADCRPAEVLETEHHRSIDELRQEWGLDLYTTDIEAVLQQADAVSLHLPSNPDTRHFMDAERLTQVRTGAILINTARGALVDEVALYDALISGRLGGAALDVFEKEPYVPVQPDKDFRTLTNVVLTPHIASNTREANRRMAEMCLTSATSFFLGR